MASAEIEVLVAQVAAHVGQLADQEERIKALERLIEAQRVEQGAVVDTIRALSDSILLATRALKEAVGDIAGAVRATNDRVDTLEGAWSDWHPGKPQTAREQRPNS